MTVIQSKRFLARNLFDGSRFLGLQLVDMTGSRLQIAPFDRETQATVFIDSRVILLQRRPDVVRSEEALMADIACIDPNDITTYPAGDSLAWQGMPVDSVIPVAL